MMAAVAIVVGYVGIVITLGWSGLALVGVHIGILAAASAFERKGK